MVNNRRSKERVKTLGEVFTPQFFVEKMLSLFEEMIQKEGGESLLDYTKTVIDDSCGNGNFLVDVMKQRMMSSISHRDAISTIYGIDIDEMNVNECKERLLMGKTDPDLKAIVDNNIICADALDPDHKGWYNVGYMWDKNKPTSKKVLNIFFDAE